MYLAAIYNNGYSSYGSQQTPMSESDWTRILEYLYNNDAAFTVSVDGERHPEEGTYQYSTNPERELYKSVLSRLSLSSKSKDDVRKVINAMKKADLIESKKGKGFIEIILTKNGFDVAHDREQSQQDRKTDQALVFFTITLVMAEILGFSPIGDSSKIVGGLVILVGIFFAIWRSELLK